MASQRKTTHVQSASNLGQEISTTLQRDINNALTSPPVFFRIHGSVWPRIVTPVALFASYAFVFGLLENLGIFPNLGSVLVPILSMVVGMLVSFRTSGAYDRWYEGRRLWAAVTVSIRNSTRNIWIMMKAPNDVKREIINLLLAYAFAIKHHCRNERGINYDDLNALLPPNFRLQYNSNETAANNLPLALAQEMQLRLLQYQADGALESTTFGLLNGTISSLVENLTAFERIGTTPIPLAYNIHLKQVITLYCLALPPQLAGNVGWWVVPVTSIAVFVFFGTDSIATEIENPFGYDANDLPVDKYCSDLVRETENMITTLSR